MINLNLPSERNLFTIAEVAGALGFSEATIRRWVKERKLQVMTFGRSVRITRESVERLCVEVAGAQH